MKAKHIKKGRLGPNKPQSLILHNFSNFTLFANINHVANLAEPYNNHQLILIAFFPLNFNYTRPADVSIIMLPSSTFLSLPSMQPLLPSNSKINTSRLRREPTPQRTKKTFIAPQTSTFFCPANFIIHPHGKHQHSHTMTKSNHTTTTRTTTAAATCAINAID